MFLWVHGFNHIEFKSLFQKKRSDITAQFQLTKQEKAAQLSYVFLKFVKNQFLFCSDFPDSSGLDIVRVCFHIQKQLPRFLEILQNSQENTCVRVSYLIKLQSSDISQHYYVCKGSSIYFKTNLQCTDLNLVRDQVLNLAPSNFTNIILQY